MKRERSAFSFEAHAARHIGLTWGFVNFSRRFTKDRESRMGRPKMICAGDRLQSGSGVLRSCNNALRSLSLSREPFGEILDISNLLDDFTATSARPFDCGLYADETLCLISHFLRKSFVRLASNSGPPSLDSSSGTPKVEQRERRQATSPRAPDQADPVGVEKISTHPDRRSPATR